MCPLGTTHTQKTVGEDAALQIRLELVLDELRQARACLRLDLGEEVLEFFLHDPIERRFLRPVPLVAEPCARLRGLPCRRHDALGPRARSCTTDGDRTRDHPRARALAPYPILPTRNPHDVALAANLRSG